MLTATTLVGDICNVFQVLIALRYYASGRFLKVIADTMGVSKASARRSLLAVSQCLENLSPNWIAFPASNTDLNVSTIWSKTGIRNSQSIKRFTNFWHKFLSKSELSKS